MPTVLPPLTILIIFAILAGFFRRILFIVVLVLLVQLVLFILFPSILNAYIHIVEAVRSSLA